MAEAMRVRLQPLAQQIQALVAVVAWEPVVKMLSLVRLAVQVSSLFGI